MKRIKPSLDKGSMLPRARGGKCIGGAMRMERLFSRRFFDSASLSDSWDDDTPFSKTGVKRTHTAFMSQIRSTGTFVC